jgi:putative membrane protein insertion efficiency factor
MATHQDSTRNIDDNITPPAPPLPLFGWLLIHLVLLYRVTLGHFMGGHCRFHPTCSQYAIDAIQKYGPWRGGWKAIRRIARCHPWGGKGYDPA